MNVLCFGELNFICHVSNSVTQYHKTLLLFMLSVPIYHTENNQSNFLISFFFFFSLQITSECGEKIQVTAAISVGHQW